MADHAPLRLSQIEAAQRLRDRLPNWCATDAAIAALGQACPGFDPPAVLLKVAVVNQLYATNLLAVHRMAQHISALIPQQGLAAAGAGFVEQIAKLPDSAGGKKGRRHLSFASKFAHCFIHEDCFPIYDRYAALMVNLHLGRRPVAPDSPPPYVEYAADIAALQQQIGTTCSASAIDRYLWLAGQYYEWRRLRKKKKTPMLNSETSDLFQDTSAQVRSELENLLPESLCRQ